MTGKIIYCYDAYCGWCYGFSPVIKSIAEEFHDRLEFEVLSGGMILGENPVPLSVLADYIREAYPVVEAHTGIRFGSDYLWHIQNPDLTDWFPDSEKPAIALCIFKEYHPDRQVDFAADLQYSLHFEGRDLCDNEAYRHLLIKYSIPDDEFYPKLKQDAYREQAYQEFALCRQLKVTGFPTVFFQESETRFHLLARGYTSFSIFRETLENTIKDRVYIQK